MKTSSFHNYDRSFLNYSSYPSPAAFVKGVTNEVYSQWLSTVPKDYPISLFVKIPNGSGKAWVFPPKDGTNQRVVTFDVYFDAIRREIAEIARRIGKRRTVTNVHFGGRGCLMGAHHLNGVMDEIRTHFELSQAVKLSIEITPDDITIGLLKAIQTNRFNRVVIDVQDHTLAAPTSDFIATPSIAEQVVNTLRRTGIKTVNLKLHYGLPYQTSDIVVESIERALALKPARISLSGYENVLLMQDIKKGKTEFTGDAGCRSQQAALHAMVTELMMEKGYKTVGIDNFAASEDNIVGLWAKRNVKRFFQSYTDNQSKVLIGFGAGATTILDEGYVISETSIADYTGRVLAECLAVAKGIKLDADDVIRRDVINALMCYFEADVAGIAAKHGGRIDDYLPEFQILSRLQKDGLVDVFGFAVKATGTGKPFIKTICSVFDRYIDNSELGLSVASGVKSAM